MNDGFEGALLQEEMPIVFIDEWPEQADAPGFDEPAVPVPAVLFVGVDLGTSRSAIATSTGIRRVVGSVVGRPRDRISSKLHGDGSLFGDDALEHRLSCDLIHPLAEGNLAYLRVEDPEQRRRHRKAAHDLVRHLVELCQVVPEERVFAVFGAPAEASKADKRAIVELARAAGVDAAMVVSEPFSVAYGIDALEDSIVVDIGAGTVDLCRMRGAYPETDDEITIVGGGDRIDRVLAQLIRQNHPQAQFTLNMVKRAKERFSGVLASTDRAIVTFPVDGRPTDLDVTEEVRAAVASIIPEVVEGIQRLVATFDPEFQHRLRQRIFVSGGGSRIFGLRAALEAGLQEFGGGRVELVDEPTYAGAGGALRLAREMPRRFWERLVL